MRCTIGVVGQYWVGVQPGQGVTNRHHSRRVLESSTTEGDSPVDEMVVDFLDSVPEYHGTREILWEAGGTTLQG
jgi:hypothetical protein